jgi:phosphohistidine phosphatase
MLRIRMKRLYLLRHAKSSRDDAGLADRDRPLAPRGRRATKVMAKHLREDRIEPDLILCSPSVRTRETLVGIGIGDGAEVRFEGDIYGASEEDLLDVLRRVPDDIDSVMLIGHNPALQALAVTLAGEGSEIPRMRQKFPTAALATLDFDGGWGELAPGVAELASFVSPKELARAGLGRRDAPRRAAP